MSFFDHGIGLVQSVLHSLKCVDILTPVRVVDPMEALTNVLKNFLLARQNKNESTIDYIKQRKQIGATLLKFLGPNFLDHYMTTTEWYIEADQDERVGLLKQSTQLWQSYLMVRNGDKEMFEDLTKHL